MNVRSRSGGDPLHAMLVAVDGGPLETLAPLATHLGCALADLDDAAADREDFWRHSLARAGSRVLVVGTSDSARGRRIESAARRAARASDIPVVAIEDFPGNYCDAPDAAASLVIVESEPAREICSTRLRGAAPPIEVVASARYDRYRARLSALREATRAGWMREPRPKVLWAGQPETADCLATLQALLPGLRTRGAELLFKAHPRDAGYEQGVYAALLEGIEWRDFTCATVEQTLAEAPGLIVTQFSWVAVEAGFYAIPSLWVLLPGAGGGRLIEKKSYRVPPLCAAGGADCVHNAAEIERVLDRALYDVAHRTRVIAQFDAYYEAGHITTRALAARVRLEALAHPQKSR